jgi:hypothetical protein
MFRCDHCHTEFGGIRGLAAGTCPRCTEQTASAERRDWSTRPFASAPAAARSSVVGRSEAELRLARRAS